MKKLILTIALSSLLVACGDDEEKVVKKEEPVEEVVTEEVAEEASKSIAPSVEEYETRYKNGLSMAFSPSTVEEVENNRYSISLDSDIVLLMDVNKNKEVIEVNVVASTDSFNDKKS